MFVTMTIGGLLTTTVVLAVVGSYATRYVVNKAIMEFQDLDAYKNYKAAKLAAEQKATWEAEQAKAARPASVKPLIKKAKKVSPH